MTKCKHSIALISRQGKSSWVSCQSITSNLIKAYNLSYQNNVDLLETCHPFDAYQARLLAGKIRDHGHEKVIFVDHHPCAAEIIKYLSPEIEIVVHLFGDFVLQLGSWLEIPREKYNIKFITASKRQANLVELLLESQERIEVIPFPLEDEFFAREYELQSQSTEYQFVYAGRLNHQKNILELIEGFINFKKNFSGNAKLKIVGMPDNLGIPYLGKEILPGTFAHQYYQLIREMKDDSIEYLGTLNRKDLRQLFLQSDCFVSVSAYNDEDYGMAVAEALACGMDCLLSNWGGYAQFAELFPDNVQLVSLDRESLKPLQVELVKKMYMICSERKSFQEKIHLSQLAEKTFSVNSTSVRLENLGRIELFHGWNDLLDQVVGCFSMMPHAPFSNGKGGYSQLYRKLYDSYLGIES